MSAALHPQDKRKIRKANLEKTYACSEQITHIFDTSVQEIEMTNGYKINLPQQLRCLTLESVVLPPTDFIFDEDPTNPLEGDNQIVFSEGFEIESSKVEVKTQTRTVCVSLPCTFTPIEEITVTNNIAMITTCEPHNILSNTLIYLLNSTQMVTRNHEHFPQWVVLDVTEKTIRCKISSYSPSSSTTNLEPTTIYIPAPTNRNEIAKMINTHIQMMQTSKKIIVEPTVGGYNVRETNEENSFFVPQLLPTESFHHNFLLRFDPEEIRKHLENEYYDRLALILTLLFNPPLVPELQKLNINGVNFSVMQGEFSPIQLCDYLTEVVGSKAAPEKKVQFSYSPTTGLFEATSETPFKISFSTELCQVMGNMKQTDSPNQYRSTNRRFYACCSASNQNSAPFNRYVVNVDDSIRLKLICMSVEEYYLKNNLTIESRPEEGYENMNLIAKGEVPNFTKKVTFLLEKSCILKKLKLCTTGLSFKSQLKLSELEQRRYLFMRIEELCNVSGVTDIFGKVDRYDCVLTNNKSGEGEFILQKPVTYIINQRNPCREITIRFYTENGNLFNTRNLNNRISFSC